MWLRWLCVSLLVLMAQETTADAEYIDVAKYDMVYYNLTTRLGLNGELEDAGRFPPFNARIVYRGMSCNCKDLTCGCCAGINMTAINFDRTACTNFTYVPSEFAIRVAVTMNDRVVYTNMLSAKNPPPVCLPFTLLPIVNFCVRFFDIYTPGNNLHACVDFETRVSSWPILILHFNCLKIGADGVSWAKPEGGSNVFDSKPNGTDNVYDNVDFEQDIELPNNQTLNLTSEQEAAIGQLKL